MDNLKIFYSKIMEDEALADKLNQILEDVEDEISDEKCQKVPKSRRACKGSRRYAYCR